KGSGLFLEYFRFRIRICEPRIATSVVEGLLSQPEAPTASQARAFLSLAQQSEQYSKDNFSTNNDLLKDIVKNPPPLQPAQTAPTVLTLVAVSPGALWGSTGLSGSSLHSGGPGCRFGSVTTPGLEHVLYAGGHKREQQFLDSSTDYTSLSVSSSEPSSAVVGDKKMTTMTTTKRNGKQTKDRVKEIVGADTEEDQGEDDKVS
ncbi:hypothetical protein PROFUN_17124, partial [Planoprotostelium fungivorum]